MWCIAITPSSLPSHNVGLYHTHTQTHTFEGLCHVVHAIHEVPDTTHGAIECVSHARLGRPRPRHVEVEGFELKAEAVITRVSAT